MTSVVLGAVLISAITLTCSGRHSDLSDVPGHVDVEFGRNYLDDALEKVDPYFSIPEETKENLNEDSDEDWPRGEYMDDYNKPKYDKKDKPKYDKKDKPEHDKKDKPKYDTYKDKKSKDKPKQREYSNFGNPSTPLSGKWPYQCDEDVKYKCDPSMKYRTFDGRCNNLNHPTWGQASMCVDRLFPPDYADGKEEMKESKSGAPLPNARVLSVELSKSTPLDSEKKVSHMVMQLGQAITHDLTLTPGPDLECCEKKFKDDPLCNQVMIPKNDPFYSKFDVRCHAFTRKVECKYCPKGPRQQPNSVTSFVDANFIYGSDSKTAMSLRDKDGLLKVTNHPTSGELLPLSRNPKSDMCSIPDKNLLCSRGADNFTNITPGILSTFSMFVRDHNRIARGLRGLNPKWSDDKVYFETRQIVSARWQMITYNEYLPAVLGKERTEYFSLRPRKSGYTTYEPETNPTLMHAFGVAAFRFGHAQSQSFFSEYPKTDRVNGRFLRDIFLMPWIVYNGELETVIRGLVYDKSFKVAPTYVPDLRNYLFRRTPAKFGQDLLLRDIMRGRDIGLPGYVNYVRFCKGPKIEKFSDLKDIMPEKIVKVLEELYKDVKDIDLIVGGLAEKHYPGSLIGPTFTCIIGLQFYHAKYGDRFYFEHNKQVGSFTSGQLETLRKTLFSKLICDASNIKDIQREVMYVPSKENPLMRCNELPDIDLTEWKDKGKKDDKDEPEKKWKKKKY